MGFLISAPGVLLRRVDLRVFGLTCSFPGAKVWEDGQQRDLEMKGCLTSSAGTGHDRSALHDIARKSKLQALVRKPLIPSNSGLECSSNCSFTKGIEVGASQSSLQVSLAVAVAHGGNWMIQLP